MLILNASGGLEKEMPADYALRLNRDAQVGTLEGALPLLSSGGRVVFVTSHLAHFHGERPVMPEYDPVASSKHAGEQPLRERIGELRAIGVDLVMVSGDLIEGTVTPKLLNRVRPGMIEERRTQTGHLPTIEEFARAIANAAAAETFETEETIYVGGLVG